MYWKLKNYSISDFSFPVNHDNNIEFKLHVSNLLGFFFLQILTYNSEYVVSTYKIKRSLQCSDKDALYFAWNNHNSEKKCDFIHRVYKFISQFRFFILMTNQWFLVHLTTCILFYVKMILHYRGIKFFTVIFNACSSQILILIKHCSTCRLLSL